MAKSQPIVLKTEIMPTGTIQQGGGEEVGRISEKSLYPPVLPTLVGAIVSAVMHQRKEGQPTDLWIALYDKIISYQFELIVFFSKVAVAVGSYVENTV